MGRAAPRGNGARRGEGKGCQGHTRLFPVQLLHVGIPGRIQDEQGHKDDPQGAGSELCSGQGRELFLKLPGCLFLW